MNRCFTMKNVDGWRLFKKWEEEWLLSIEMVGVALESVQCYGCRSVVKPAREVRAVLDELASADATDSIVLLVEIVQERYY